MIDHYFDHDHKIRSQEEAMLLCYAMLGLLQDAVDDGFELATGEGVPAQKGALHRQAIGVSPEHRHEALLVGIASSHLVHGYVPEYTHICTYI